MQRQTLHLVLILFIYTISFTSLAWSAILIDDVTTKSGVAPVIGDGNTMKLKNELRRRAYALFYLIEATDGEGNIVTYSSESPIEGIRIPSTQKLEGLIGTILQVIQGNTAFTPAYSNEIVLELPDDCNDCQKARYRVVVVGPGASYGDGIEGLNTEEERLVKQLQRETFIFDIAIPVILILLPDNVKDYLGEEINLIYEDLLLLSSFTPLVDTVMTKLMEGDIKGASQDFFNSFITDSDLHEELATYLVKRLEGEAKEQAKTAIKAALGTLDFTNIIMTVLDQIAVVNDIASGDTHMADLWYLQVMPKTVSISPRSSVISQNEKVNFTVQVKDGGEPYKGKVIFQWETDYLKGSLTADDASGTYIVTEDNTVEYVPSPADYGKDVVKVTAYDNETKIDTASANIRILEPDAGVVSHAGFRAIYWIARECGVNDKFSGNIERCRTDDCIVCSDNQPNAGEKCIAGTCYGTLYLWTYYPYPCDTDTTTCLCYWYEEPGKSGSWHSSTNNMFDCMWFREIDDHGFPIFPAIGEDPMEKVSYLSHPVLFSKILDEEGNWVCPCELLE